MKFLLLFRRFYFLFFFSLFSPILSAIDLHPYLNLKYEEVDDDYGGKNFQIIDLFKFHKEADAIHYPGLKTINAAEIFKVGTVFLGFGMPNVYMARIVLDENGEPALKKFDVKSLHRAESTIVESNGTAQSGYFIVLKNMTEEAVKRVVVAVKERKGHTFPTCAQGNYEALRAAGFSIYAQDPSAHYYLPTSLFQSILANGILFDGAKVQFDIVKTTPHNLQTYMGMLSNAIIKTPYRHHQKDNVTPEYIEAAKKNAVLIAKENARLLKEHPASPPANRVFTLETSEPSTMGSFARKIWGAHTLYKISITGEGKPRVEDYLPKILKEFPKANPDCFTRLKRNWMFSKNSVSWINNNMASRFSDPRLIDESHILELLKPHTKEHPNKFNLVLTDEHLILGKLSVHFGWIDWVLSKHVLLSDYSDKVHFAGEISKVINENGEEILVLSNDSGSYQPSKEELAAALSYARELLPHVKIEAEGLSSKDLDEKVREDAFEEKKVAKEQTQDENLLTHRLLSEAKN